MVPSFLKYAQAHGWLVANLQTLINENYVIDHLDGNHGSLYPRKEEFVSSGVKYLSANALANNRVNLAKSKYLSDDRAAQFKKGVARDGDVLFAHNATVGPVAQLKTDDEKIIISTSLTYYRVDPEKLDGSYLAQFMASSAFVRQYESIMRQTTRNQIPITTQREFVFAVPPLPEQKKIAQILSTWDQAITATERLLENSQQRKKGLMQQLLTGKQRLPGFEGEWDRKPLGEIARVYQPKTISQSSLKEHGYPVYGANGLIGFYDHYNHEYEQIAVTCRGSTCGLVNWTRSKSWITGNAMVINVDDNPEVDKRYLYYVLARSSLDYLVTGSGQPQITGDIKRHEVLLPSINEQSTISKIIHKADQDIEQLQKYVACLKQEKHALMQQLLTGKRRVNVDTEAA